MIAKSVRLFFLFSAVLFICKRTTRGKLVLLQTLFRHGDRSPTYTYPNDPNPVDVWKEGLGKLTPRGRLQHYMLGKRIRSLYSDFITSSPNEVMANSTGLDRCLRSAESHLASLYAPTPEWQFSPGLNWQPIHVQYFELEVDRYLNPKVDCPRADAEEARFFNSTKFTNFYEENEYMLEDLSICSGENLTLELVEHLQDTLEIEKEYHLEIPSCMEPYYEQLRTFANVIHFGIYKSPLIQRLRAGPLLGKMIESMKRKIAGDIPDLKVHVYSARDRNLAAVLQALGVFNNRHPPYCTTILFELHQFIDVPYVRLLLMNSTRPEDGNQEPHLLQLDGCGEYCPLDYFVGRTKHLVPKDFGQECQLDS